MLKIAAKQVLVLLVMAGFITALSSCHKEGCPGQITKDNVRQQEVG